MGIAFVVLGLISHFGLQSTIYLDIDMTAATSPGQKPKPHMEIYRKTSEGHDQVWNETDDFPLSFRGGGDLGWRTQALSYCLSSKLHFLRNHTVQVHSLLFLQREIMWDCLAGASATVCGCARPFSYSPLKQTFLLWHGTMRGRATWSRAPTNDLIHLYILQFLPQSSGTFGQKIALHESLVKHWLGVHNNLMLV